jgi:hypothetical protein
MDYRTKYKSQNYKIYTAKYNGKYFLPCVKQRYIEYSTEVFIRGDMMDFIINKL